MSVFLRDGLDGTYEGLFTIKDPGNYTVHCTLEHSGCEGLRDPPADWFAKGE